MLVHERARWASSTMRLATMRCVGAAWALSLVCPIARIADWADMATKLESATDVRTRLIVMPPRARRCPRFDGTFEANASKWARLACWLPDPVLVRPIRALSRCHRALRALRAKWTRSAHIIRRPMRCRVECATRAGRRFSAARRAKVSRWASAFAGTDALRMDCRGPTDVASQAPASIQGCAPPPVSAMGGHETQERCLGGLSPCVHVLRWYSVLERKWRS